MSFTLRKVMLCVVYTMILSCLSLSDAKASIATVVPAAADSTFTVEKFRQLPTDVSASLMPYATSTARRAHCSR